MKLRSILAAFAVMMCGSVFAQNATKAELDALAQRVSKLEMDLERVITENVNLVDQLNVRTVTKTRCPNGLFWDIVKVEAYDNNVVLTLRITNPTAKEWNISFYPSNSFAIDTNSNLDDNKYYINGDWGREKLIQNISVNKTVTIKNVPQTCSYLAHVELSYMDYWQGKPTPVKFSGVHIPW